MVYSEQSSAGTAFGDSNMRSSDCLVVWKLDRLARSMRQLIETFEDLLTRKIGFRSLTKDIDTTTPSGELMFHIFGALAQFERCLIRECVNAGLAAVRSRGRVGGRPKVSAEAIVQAKAMIKGGMSASRAAKLARISRSTLYRASMG